MGATAKNDLDRSLPIAIPSAIDPPIRGADHRPGRHVKRALTVGRRLAPRAVVCSACPGRWRTGCAAPTHGPRPANAPSGHPGVGAPPPEARSEADRFAAQVARRRGVVSTPRVPCPSGRLSAC